MYICICKGHHLPFGKQNRIHKHVCKYLLTSNSKKHHSSQIINVGSIKSKNSFFSRHITTKKEMLPNDSYNFHFDSYFKGQNVQNIDDTYISVYLCDIFISFPRLYEAMNSKCKPMLVKVNSIEMIYISAPKGYFILYTSLESEMRNDKNTYL